MYPTNKDRTTVIDPSYHWQPISTAPLGKKVQLINEAAGVATYGQVNGTKEQFFTHWAPLPTFAKHGALPKAIPKAPPVRLETTIRFSKLKMAVLGVLTVFAFGTLIHLDKLIKYICALL